MHQRATLSTRRCRSVEAQEAARRSHNHCFLLKRLTTFSWIHGVVERARPIRSGTAKRATLTKPKASAPSFVKSSWSVKSGQWPITSRYPKMQRGTEMVQKASSQAAYEMAPATPASLICCSMFFSSDSSTSDSSNSASSANAAALAMSLSLMSLSLASPSLSQLGSLGALRIAAPAAEQRERRSPIAICPSCRSLSSRSALSHCARRSSLISTVCDPSCFKWRALRRARAAGAATCKCWRRASDSRPSA
mmetsp:Transcript_34006/g.56301  ORF Transcript_34006/g.56301 Transcript_34006/m.56301 type:complete len:250 (+) Transcript_34006:433-1182(+)